MNFAWERLGDGVYRCRLPFLDVSIGLVYGDTGTANPTFGQFVAVGTATNAIPAFANIDPPRMFQLQARFVF